MSCGSLSPSAAAAVLASRAEMPIRIAPVTSFNNAQRPVSSSSSSQRASCFGRSVLPSVRSVVTTSERVGGGGLLLRLDTCPRASLPLPLAGEVGSSDSALALSGDTGGGSFSPLSKRPGPPPPPPPPPGGGGDIRPPHPPPPPKNPTKTNHKPNNNPTAPT